jgi:exocyst complex component 1
LEQLTPAIYHENEFITDFLQINDAALTYADYMGLDSYFQRQAARSSGLSQSTQKLIRGAMDLIFGFLPAEFKAWMDNVLAKDHLEVIGVIAVLERFKLESELRSNPFVRNLFSKQHTRLRAVFDRHVVSYVLIILNLSHYASRKNK